jgi:hypothetical protein
VDTAVLLANLLAGDLGAETVPPPMLQFNYNPAVTTVECVAPKGGANPCLIPFAPPAAGVTTRPMAAQKVAFIATGDTASASELVMNVLDAYPKLADAVTDRRVAIIGDRTYGKPVGQTIHTISACGLALFLVEIRLTNALGNGDYYDGLPDTAGHFTGPLCPAPDDLTHPLGDPAEGSVKEALTWITTGACSPAPAAAFRAGPAPRGPDLHPLPAEPTLAQREMPGLF